MPLTLRFIICTLSILPFLWLTSCSTINNNLKVPILWPTQNEALTRLTHWRIEGKLAVKNQQTGGHGNFYWQQNQELFDIEIHAPIGNDKVLLEGHQTYVQVIDTNGKQYQSSSAEDLFLKEFGWHLPVSELIYWIKGLPFPSQPYRYHIDRKKQIFQLEQNGWLIQYDFLLYQNHLFLPKKLVITHPNAEIKILIKQWNTGN